ncbi:MAG: hypothetical protein HOV80_01345 [Polyangiaceae bacterium]|nr:hypothetical protein [Polyangiaceae bacterium]
MRVRTDVSRAAEVAPRERPAAREVETRATPLSTGQIHTALGAAYKKLHGRAPPKELLDMLTAQVCTETASGARMHDFNFGGIKGQSASGLTAKVRTKEILEGKEVSIRDGFRAYRNPVEGAVDYVAFLEKRFPKALDAAERGDVDAYVGHLKAGRYFTADEAMYANAVRTHRDVTVRGGDLGPTTLEQSSRESLVGPTDELVLPSTGDGFATAAAVARVLDAMAASAVALATPGDEENWS